MLIKSHSLMQHLKPRFLLLDIKIGPREQQRSQRPILIIFYTRSTRPPCSFSTSLAIELLTGA
jgi:hypothetical protein